MTFEDALWQTASGGTPSYSAREFRALPAELYDEGVLENLKVVERGAGANMSVDINVGGAIIQGDDQARQGNYLVRCTALENKTVTAAPGSNSRLDLVVVEHLDPDSGGAAGRITQFRVIAGTPAASPVLPALPPTAIPLAQLGPITTSTTSITNSLITDLRVWAGFRTEPGTIRYVAPGPLPSGWLACDGAAVSRTTYARLFDRVGTTYGVGDGSTTFNVPDARGRALFCANNYGTNGTATGDDRVSGSRGASGGNTQLAQHLHANGTLEIGDPDHEHSGPSHTHDAVGTITIEARLASVGGDFLAYSPDGAAGSPSSANIAGATAAAGTGATGSGNLNPTINGSTANTGTGTAGNVPPYLMVGAIVRT